jgi:hypothetical protein
MLYERRIFRNHDFKEESNEPTVRYTGGGFEPSKTEDFLPNVSPQKE